MAVGISEPIVAYVTNTDATSYTHSSSYTPGANTIQIAFVSVTATALTSPPFSGGSLTWNILDEETYNSVSKIYSYYAITGGSPASCTPSIDLTGDGGTGCIMVFFEISGADTSSPIVQHKDASATSANPTVTLTSAMTSTSAILAAWAAPRNPPGSSGWGTETNDTGHTSPTNGLASAYSTGETGTSVTFTASSTNWGLSVVEVAVASTPSVTSIWGNLQMMGVG